MNEAVRTSRRRGNVLMEFVLIIPLLATILGLTFFFGWAFTNQQHVKVSDRFQCWRRVRAGSKASVSQLNAWFFQNRANEDTFDQGGGSGPTETLRDLIDTVGNFSTRAEGLAEGVVWNRAERGRRAMVAAEFPSEVGIYQQFTGKIKHDHTRDGREWRWRQLRCEPVIRDEFLSELDSVLESIPSPGDSLGEMARKLYLSAW